jgi:hypothetical protein
LSPAVNDSSSKVRFVRDQSVDSATQSNKLPGRIVHGPDIDIPSGGKRTFHKIARSHASFDGREVRLEFRQITDGLRNQLPH